MFSTIITKIKEGLISENPVFRLLLGTCPTLAVTTSLENAIGMGVATTFVLVCSNVIISMIRKIVPDKIRIPIYIIVIASFVTIVDLILQAFTPALYTSLGLFIPLIVVNCIILGRAEGYSSKHPIFLSFIDGIAMGLGFIFALSVLGSTREILGNGQLAFKFLKWDLGKIDFKTWGLNPALVMILPPGGFLVLGYVIGYLNKK